MRQPTAQRRSGPALGLALLLAGLAARTAPAAGLVLQVAAPTNGTVIAALYDSAGTFVNLRDPLRVVTLDPAAGGRGSLTNLPAGEYALVVYLDENGNGQLDKNFIGIPREPLGFSNRYWPHGPPTFARAAFPLGAEETKAIDVDLRSVFGKRGRIGVGAGAIVQTSPYRGADALVVQPIPAISYIGDRVQVIGPSAQIGLQKRGGLGLAATASYRMGAYREEDSDYLQGLGDRDATLMAGLAVQAELPAGFDLSAGYEHDALGRSSGGNGRVALEKSFQRGALTFSPEVALNGLTAELADYEFGVSARRATAGRPAYEPGAALTTEAGLGLSIELSGAWRIILNGSVTFLPPALTESPLVDTAQVYSSFMAVTWLF